MVLILCLLAALTAGPPIRIVLVGDSTVNDEGGWGPGFRAFFGADAEVINLAKNGRSSKSFRDEGLWAPALAAKPNYILIQFGHNDGPGKGPERETDPATTYRENLARYIDEARAAGADCILIIMAALENAAAAELEAAAFALGMDVLADGFTDLATVVRSGRPFADQPLGDGDHPEWPEFARNMAML